jgi:hypothetical protein
MGAIVIHIGHREIFTFGMTLDWTVQSSGVCLGMPARKLAVYKAQRISPLPGMKKLKIE